MEIFSYFASFDGKEQIKIEMKFKLIVENGTGLNTFEENHIRISPKTTFT